MHLPMAVSFVLIVYFMFLENYRKDIGTEDTSEMVVMTFLSAVVTAMICAIPIMAYLDLVIDVI